MNGPPPDSGITTETWDGMAEEDRARVEQTMREIASVRARAAAQYYDEMDRSGGGCPPWQNAPAHIRDHYLKHALYALQPRYVGIEDVELDTPRIVGATLEGHRRRYNKVVQRIRTATKYTLYTLFAVFVALVLWLAVTAPLSQSLQPIAAPSYTVIAADGQTIARRGAIRAGPVNVLELPPFVSQAFVSVEDRRFYRHLGIDPWGVARAAFRNWQAGRVREGGSTISQQLAKTSFTGGERTWGRKLQEALITIWLEAWLSKEEILSRYLSNVYFGNNIYGLRAAARFYFSVEPEELTLPQATMLAGLVNAPNRLAPNRNLAGARRRAALVTQEMVDAGALSEREAARLRPARLRLARTRDEVPTGTYFADWVLAAAENREDSRYGEREIETTLEPALQRAAIAAFRDARLGRSQAALVAMRPDGRVVAMLGGRNYGDSPFNRATQARRQPGSTFKLFVYLAALRAGMSPDDLVEDTPITTGEYRPRNSDGVYRGEITLAEAFAVSSNVAAVRLAQRVGMNNVIRAARDLGVTAPIPANDPSIALGTADVSLIEMTAAYAAVAGGRYPVAPHGIVEQAEEQGVVGRLFGPILDMADGGRSDPNFPALRALLEGAVVGGTGRAAALSIPTFGKTGTTQDYRDALFIGFAGDLVVGIWVGNDDNRPMSRVAGGGMPARIWRSFMMRAQDLR
ncbi:transglycosylase domain-containing protein [Sphingosinicella sp.]|uniref:transglycosylase domain-containing protein n=1 Tax=Sphingosinicella sp. TaxID=1917971 RepID=UPI00403782C4